MSKGYDFRYENSITNGKIIEVDGEYSQWRTNNILANYQDTVYYANEMNINHDVTNEMHYNFLYGTIRKRKRWNKAETKEEKKEREHRDELISLISDHYKYNLVRAKEVLKILTPNEIDIIRKQKEKGGIK
jgi:hypothetical protein